MNPKNIKKFAGSKRSSKHIVAFPLILFTLLVTLLGQSVYAHPVQGSALVNSQEKSAARERTPLIKKTVHAIYEGQADGHTVEVSVYGEPIALQFKQGLEPKISLLESGDAVVITYTVQKFVDDPVVLLCNLLSIRKLESGEVKYTTF
ncbi:hypothetical protein ACFRAM_12635 [Paenibacillus sp. NPDC056722]|uniref:hypothetical protein n=1 Tax=Paenibacillus sp. NPDC056722 TaxID=3345924 RepID=UPI00367E2178